MAEASTFVTIRGNIEYSRLIVPIDGDELERDMSRRMHAGLPPIDLPYTTIRITNARILPRDPGGAWTAEEACVGQRLYRDPFGGPNGPMHFLCINRYASLPVRFFMSQIHAPDRPNPIVPEHELANGLDVILILRVSMAQEPRDTDVRVDSVILMEPIRYQEQP